MKFSRKYYLLFCLVIITNQVLGQSSFIESVSPKSGYAGKLVNIKGVGLEDADQVFFGSVEGRIVSATNQLIEAEVPNGTTYDNVTVFNSSTRLYYSGEHFMLSYGGNQGLASTDFDSQIDVFSESGLYDVTISDIDGDGKNDIIGANSKSPFATILRNLSTPGNISLAKTKLNLGAPSFNNTAGDLNGDGKPEVVFSVGNKLMILVNFSTPGNLSFTLQTISLNSSSTKRVVIKDLDLDGKPDLVVSDQTVNKIFIVKNTSSGGTLTFSNDIIELTVDNAQSTSGLDVEDLNGDGKPEIITNQFLTDGGGFYIATNQSSPGNFSFSGFNQFNSAGTFVNLKVGDINNDNKPDIVATLFLSSAVAVFVNETNSTGGQLQFGSAQNLGTDLRPWGLDFGDLDGDGNIDIAVSTIGSNKTINVLNNNGSGGVNFSKIAVPVTFINRNIKIGDIDGDSKPDIVFSSVDDETNNITSSNISILRNNRCIIPVITPEGPINSCEGNSVVLQTQNIAGLTYEWRQDGNVVKSGPESFIELNDISASGSYTVSIISEGGSCSEISEEVDVTIISAGSLPSANISSNQPVCVGGTLTLNSSDVGATTYEWRGPQNFTATGISVDVANFNVNKAGRYYLDIYAGSCIIETKSIVVDIVSAPNFSIGQSGEGTYCEGENIVLSISPNDTDFALQWYKDESPISGATSATFNPTNSGSYYVEITDQVNTFCPNIYSDTLEVAFLDSPQVDFNLSSTACVATPVSFTNESVVADESLAQYDWDFGDGSVSTDPNPTHTYNSAGTFEVTLEVSYEGFSSCTSQLSQQIVINGALNVAINSSAISICDGENATLSVDDTFESYQWNTGETSSTITVNEGGTYSVTVADENGCEGFSEISIQTSPIPNVAITASGTSVSAGDTVSLTASGLIEYLWFADSTSLNYTNDQIEYAPSSTTTIRVEGKDENGCFGSAEIVIMVEEEANIGDRISPMKFFSPNNDAIAQFWEIENIESFTQCGVEIYDQQGNKIYEAKPYNNDWEGTASGSPVPDGVYYYVIRCEDSGIVKSGSITLLR
ncbi:VCBS repeat-containing protein [Marivirga sp. S37H4]|uniref:VCBS repeat-containing protein n=1 Tax=Marivirga aurantiaca TaxID=2802615 RepID=A0A934WVX9_9BACT|nr:FG-GAP-like repeat-containing protein [Marivirga aurantiaca]MBK6263840.1 VCBS repeat-containing protein [Marivirga aurantiaca]